MKTTKKQFRLFCDEVKYWVNRFGLTEWRLDFMHEEPIEDGYGNQSFAWVTPSYTNRVVRVSMTTDTTCLPERLDAFIKSSAKHEAIELLVYDLRALAYATFKTEDEVIVANHTLIRRLENIIE